MNPVIQEVQKPLTERGWTIVHENGEDNYYCEESGDLRYVRIEAEMARALEAILTQEEFDREFEAFYFDGLPIHEANIKASHAALLARVRELEDRFTRMIEHRALVLQHAGHIAFENATVVRDAEGDPIAAFWSPQSAANYVDLQTADESVGRLTNERNSARLECVGLKQRIAAFCNPLPFRGASEKPEGEVLVIGEDGESLEFGEWRESRQCMGVSPHNEQGAGFVSERAGNLPIHVQGWIDPKDIINLFRAWKEGKEEG